MSNSYDLGAAGIGAIGNIAGGLISNAVSYSSNKKLAKLQAALNYYYAKKSAKEMPSFNREGLESAGYNPMLAVQNATSGANSSWTSATGVGNPDMGNLGTDVISNATDIQRVENETKTADSTAQLQTEQAKTEQDKRTNLQFDIAMKDAQKHMIDKETSWIDRKKNAEIYKDMQEAERARAEASVTAYNAETARIASKAQETSAEYGNAYKVGSTLFKKFQDWNEKSAKKQKELMKKRYPNGVPNPWN